MSKTALKLGMYKEKAMSKKNALYWIERADKVPVHYFYTDEDITVKDMCDLHGSDQQVHVFVASKRIRPKNKLKGIPR